MPGVIALVSVTVRSHCSGAAARGVGFQFIFNERENSVGQSDWFLVSCNIATVGHGKHFLGFKM